MANKTIIIKWKWILLALAVIIIFFLVAKSCDDAGYKKDIEDLDKIITEKEEENLKLEGEVVEYVNSAIAEREIVERLKAEVEESKVKIEELEKEEIEVERVVMELPPTRLVEDFQEILGCQDILLNEDGILFSVECARQGLLKLKKFSLVEGKYNEAIFALSKSEKALKHQERVSWYLFGALWKLGDQVLNYKVIGKKKDIKFEKSEKQKKKSWWNGLKIGLIIGGGVTITFVVVIPAIKKIFF